MELFLISLAFSFFLIFLLFCILVTALTCYDLRLKDFLTLWPYKHWFRIFIETFNFTFMLFGALLFSLMIYFPIKDGAEKRAMAEAGQCTCSCKACKAVVAHLGLTVEDIKRLTSSTNSIANSTSK